MNKGKDGVKKPAKRIVEEIEWRECWRRSWGASAPAADRFVRVCDETDELHVYIWKFTSRCSSEFMFTFEFLRA